ncbi:Cof-type HAD-IIB family hydrolase [Bacillus sp. JJ1521]|uniref:Cof-type HAD-IIB family hydrolase n=1 Tax=Bacillus sp. JJ1521 TaxID=3122957 RepID=UPI002FFE4B25
MKLIALDLDGTTLNSKKEISEETVKTIKKAQEQGHIVMALSGRAAHSITFELKKHGLNCIVGANNGASLYVDDDLISMITLTPEQHRKIIMELDKEFIPFNMSTNKGVFAPKNWEERLRKVLSSGLVPEENYSHKNFKIFTTPPHIYGHPIYDKTEEIIDDESITIQKFLILTFDPIQKKRIESFLNSIEGINIASATLNVDIMHVDAHKGSALKRMAEYYNIPLEDTIAIGDDANDIAMLNIAGLSIAMGNAEEEVKKYADLVTLTNDENGVAYAIEKYVLEKQTT